MVAGAGQGEVTVPHNINYTTSHTEADLERGRLVQSTVRYWSLSGRLCSCPMPRLCIISCITTPWRVEEDQVHKEEQQVELKTVQEQEEMKIELSSPYPCSLHHPRS